MREAEDVAVAILYFEFFHLVGHHLRLARDFRTFGSEFLKQRSDIAATDVSVPGEIGIGDVVGARESFAAIAAEEKFNAIAVEHDEAGRLAPNTLEREAEDVPIIFGAFHDVVHDQADANGAQVSLAIRFVRHGAFPCALVRRAAIQSAGPGRARSARRAGM